MMTRNMPTATARPSVGGCGGVGGDSRRISKGSAAGVTKAAAASKSKAPVINEPAAIAAPTKATRCKAVKPRSGKAHNTKLAQTSPCRPKARR